MCGICGFTGEVLDRDEVIKRMTDVITHRGPDSSGVFAGDGVTMGSAACPSSTWGTRATSPSIMRTAPLC